MRTLCTTAIAAGLATVFSLAYVSEASAVKGKCQTPKTAFRTTGDKAETNADKWVDLPKSKISFVQGGKKPGCVIVRFSAMPHTSHIIGIRVVLDGRATAEPGNIDLDYKSDGYISPRGFEFVFPKVPPGKHHVKIQWANWAGEHATAHLYQRTITVQHR